MSGPQKAAIVVSLAMMAAGMAAITSQVVTNISTIRVIEKRMHDRWTGKNQRDFAKKLQELNPGIKVPLD